MRQGVMTFGLVEQIDHEKQKQSEAKTSLFGAVSVLYLLCSGCVFKGAMANRQLRNGGGGQSAPEYPVQPLLAALSRTENGSDEPCVVRQTDSLGVSRFAHQATWDEVNSQRSPRVTKWTNTPNEEAQVSGIFISNLKWPNTQQGILRGCLVISAQT